MVAAQLPFSQQKQVGTRERSSPEIRAVLRDGTFESLRVG
jgi:hypothetical protein